MDVMPQPSGYLLSSASQPLSVDTILRPVSLGHGQSFSGYFTGVDLPELEASATVAAAYRPAEALTPVVGQYFDQDFLGDMGQFWNNFVESGQLWALLFGIVLGYMIRNLTAY